MKRRTSALITLGGLTASILAYALFGPILAGILALATLCFAAFRTSIIGSTTILATKPIDPKAVRQYREDHPGATISAAASIVARR
ncbi:hypothetical protein DEJ13_14625 [Curtobacterium sp. MCLR17_007]|uniref:hypothetical protein n=1 Tax=Curtobacterium sp. MCLR17_007 TaxID=2175648 RepID=UPI0011B3D5DA|nr:hypothetical protein [Curtobacterium sp. MCLR17_007]WIB59663.1 hypothetical protein DEJ13_14625 [Curtobacterium sp. MCLR17_007]